MNVRWSPEINAGHIAQAFVVLLTVGGGAVTSYVSLKSDISDVSAKMVTVTTGIDARVRVLESQRVEDQAFRADTRGKLDRLLEAVTDLKVQIGKRSELAR